MWTVVGWGLYYLLLLGIAVGVATGILFLIGKWKERGGPRAEAVRISIRAGSTQTFASLAVGLGLSIWVAFVIWDVIFTVTGLKASPAMPQGIYYMRHGLGLLLGIWAGYSLFVSGQFEIEAGNKAYLTFMGYPFGNLGVGWGWKLPWFMELKPRNIQALQDTDEEPREYLTQNGVEMFIDSGATYFVFDPLQAQGIAGTSIPDYVHARKLAAVRKLVSLRAIKLDLAFRANPTPEEQQALFADLIQVKGDVSTNGPSEVIGYMNAETQAYGIEVTQVQFETVKFNDSLEKHIERAFDEIAEGPGLQRDVLNKVAMIKIFVDEALRMIGLTYADLTRQEKLDLMKRAQAYVLAIEGQGGYNYTDFGSAAPSNVMVGLPPAPATHTGAPT